MIKPKELAAERQKSLGEYIRDRGVVRIEDLSREFDISSATVRRDLEILEEQGRIRRVHGGAMALESRLEEQMFDDKASIAFREKRRIAEKAMTMICNSETVYLDGGSTVLELARLLVNRTDITVVTNSLRAAVELSGRGPRLILVGGELRRLSQTTVGSWTRCLIEQIHVDKAFMGTMGLSFPEGTTTTDPNEAYTKELVMSRSAKTILLADSGKAGKVVFAKSGDIENIHTIITDKKFPAHLAKLFKKQGITLEQV